jgi:hypothetical protein
LQHMNMCESNILVGVWNFYISCSDQ